MKPGLPTVNVARFRRDPRRLDHAPLVPGAGGLAEQVIQAPRELADRDSQLSALDYQGPVVEIKVASKQAREQLWSWRRRPQVKQESARILALHVRPDRGRSRRGAQKA